MFKPASRLHDVFDNEAQLLAWADEVDEIAQFISDFGGLTPERVWSVLTHWTTQTGNRDEIMKYAVPKSYPTIARIVRENAQHMPEPPKIELARRVSDNWIDFTFMDLFAGIGGFHLGLSSQGGSLVFASEWDRAARLTYLANYGVLPFGDIREFTRRPSGTPRQSRDIRSRVPRADIITAGFPCQPFSKAGVSSRNHHGHAHGLRCEAQGTLFEDILLIAAATEPDALILENVGNLRFHDGGNTIRVILNEIEKTGYRVYPKWDNSNNWGVLESSLVSAQRRRRVYMVCIREDLAEALEHKKGEFRIQSPNTKPNLRTLRQVINRHKSMTDHEKYERYGISERMWESHLRRETAHKKKGNGFRIGLMSDLDTVSPTLVARYHKDGKDCLIPSTKPGAPPRMLTPRECALLQTYPESFRIPSSKTSAFKQFGNSVTVEMVRLISRQVVSYLYG